MRSGTNATMSKSCHIWFEFPPLRVTQHQIHQRRVVAEIAHRVVQTCGQEPSLIVRVVHKHAPALGDVKRVREDT